jgi:hypothetical protein
VATATGLLAQSRRGGGDGLEMARGRRKDPDGVEDRKGGEQDGHRRLPATHRMEPRLAPHPRLQSGLLHDIKLQQWIAAR